MLGGQGFGHRKFRLSCHRPQAVQVILQLADQDRGWPLGIVLDAAPHPADVQLFPGRQQGFQKQVAIVFPAGAVPRPVILRHQVEIHRRPGAGVIAVVHTQQAHFAERNGSHRHQGGEVHLASQEALVQAAFVQALQQHILDDVQRQRLVIKVCGKGIFQPLLELAAEAVQQQQVLAFHLVEKLLEHFGEQGFPFTGRAGGLQGLPQGFQLVHELA